MSQYHWDENWRIKIYARLPSLYAVEFYCPSFRSYLRPILYTEVCLRRRLIPRTFYQCNTETVRSVGKSNHDAMWTPPKEYIKTYKCVIRLKTNFNWLRKCSNYRIYILKFHEHYSLHQKKRLGQSKTIQIFSIIEISWKQMGSKI